MKTKSLRLITILVSLFLISLWGCGQPESPATGVEGGPSSGGAAPPAESGAAGPKESLIYVSNVPGSSDYPIAVAQSEVLTRNTNLTVTVQPTPGASTFPGLLESGEADIGIGLSRTPYVAYQGEAEFNKPFPIRLIMTGRDAFFTIITHEGTGIRDITDLKGHKITYNYPGIRSLSELGELMVKAYGLDPQKGLQVLPAENTTQGSVDLTEGRTDAFVGNVEGAKVQELATKVKPVYLAFDPAKIQAIQATRPSWHTAPIPKGVPNAVPGTTIPADPYSVYTVERLNEDVVYTIVKTLIERHDDLTAITPELGDWTAENAARWIGVPFHPGSVRYFQEAGIWTDELEQQQQAALK